MATQYRLRHAVTGFFQSAKQIVSIPAGAIVTARTTFTPSPGLCTVIWEDEVIEAYRIDIEDNGDVVSENESDWSTHTI